MPPASFSTEPPATSLDPAAIAGALALRVMGQDQAVREMAIALAKQLAGLRVGNILMIGSSGTGKTTLMRCASMPTSWERKRSAAAPARRSWGVC
jgi:hypothetical protein